MNIIVLHGSARRNGDTDTLAEHFLRGMATTGSHEITHFTPIDMSIAHCRACMECMKGTGCVIQDDMQNVYPAFRDADVVVMATPMFWGYMTSQLKTLFDRLEAVVCSTYFGNKDFVLLIGYRSYYGSMIEWLERITKFAGSRCHTVACQTFDPATGTDRPINQTPERLTEAFELGRRIAEVSP
ncbi:flavodoxin family protein [Candidatus Bipolaricaulota bacterium]|nr:flavodoxin family protein [Candidatus Bipolaricaulota bacterium]TFH09673.1 MAG: flavodoxin family protein [Candidatus Atribacteria bacterium]